MNTTFHRSAAFLVAFVLILCTANPTLSAGAQARALTKQETSSQLPVVHMARNICPPGYSCDPINSGDSLIASGNLVYYFADDITHGRELWVSDGTYSGTHLVKEFFPGSTGFPDYPTFVLVGFPVGDHSLLFRVQYTSASNGWYRTDGTDAGTIQLGNVSGFVFPFGNQFLILDGDPYILKTFDVNSGTITPIATLSGNCFTQQLQIGAWLYMLIKDSTSMGCENANSTTYLWKTNGTQAGTMLVRGIGTTGLLSPMVSSNNSLFFLDIGDITTGQTVCLWGSDGTFSGTALVNSFTDRGMYINQKIGVANGLVFLWMGGPNDGLWQSDGTAAGTVLVQNSPPYTADPMFAFKNAIYFRAEDDQGKMAWYKSEGKNAGGIVKLIGIAPYDNPDPDDPNSNFYSNHFAANGLLYLPGDSGSGHNVYWVTDGTNLTALLGSQVYTAPDNPAVIDSHLFFTAWDAEAGNELWTSDGTPAGTLRLADMHANDPAGTKSSGPRNLTAAGSHLFFTADAGIDGRQLWVADFTLTRRSYLPLMMH